MYDYPEPPPGRVSLIISGILKILFGGFCMLAASLFASIPILAVMITVLYGLEILSGILGICFSKSEAIGTSVVLIVLSGLSLALYLMSGLGGGFNNPILIIGLAINIWFVISAIRNLSNARSIKKEQQTLSPQQ